MNDIPGNDRGKGRTLLLVHGHDFKPAADVYFDLALSAIRAGLERDYPDEIDDYLTINKRISYYGDVIDRLLCGLGLDYDDVLDVGDLRNALAQLKMFTKRKQFGVDRYDRLPGKTAAKEFAVGTIAPLLIPLGFNKPVIARVAKDIKEYWYGDGSFAEAVRTRVHDKISAAMDADEKIMLVSHGFGAIVTYDVLWELSHDEKFAAERRRQKIDTWVTLGAPLGDVLVSRRLFGAKEKGRRKYPTNVVAWKNLAAEDDYMSHDNTLADDFKPMLKLRLVSSIRDHMMYNLCVRYGKSNPHNVLGYLIHPRFAQVLVEWLKAGPPAPAVHNIF